MNAPPSSDEPAYEVDQLAKVMQQTRDLMKRAASIGRKAEYLAALQTMMEKLRIDPLKWGDPVYHPKKKGSLACHTIVGPLFVQYVVYELERKVLILQIKKAKRHFLLEDDNDPTA